MPKTRPIEMYVGYDNGSGSGTWSTEYVEIQLDTPEEKIPAVACAEMERILGEREVNNYAFCGVYSIPEPEDDSEEEA